ncbi:MAG: hypothetical protein HQM16_13770 [Deltaproteobacteria bacterium]|nr:hypothetical protein [Deltaproteobacteria bacterium]
MDTLAILQSSLQNLIRNSMPALLPHDLPYITKDFVRDCGRIDVKNNLADLLCDFRRINQDWNNLIEFGKEHFSIIKNPDHAQHKEFRQLGTQLLNFVLVRVVSSLKIVEDTLILVRIYVHTDRPFFRFKQPFIWPCELLIDIEKERKKLATEKQSQ